MAVRAKIISLYVFVSKMKADNNKSCGWGPFSRCSLQRAADLIFFFVFSHWVLIYRVNNIIYLHLPSMIPSFPEGNLLLIHSSIEQL